MIQIQVSKAARDNALELMDRIGIKQFVFASRLIEWFADQPSTVQAAILGLYRDVIDPDVTRQIWEHIANPPPAKTPEPDRPERAAKRGKGKT
jgi:hypothetical protein